MESAGAGVAAPTQAGGIRLHLEVRLPWPDGGAMGSVVGVPPPTDGSADLRGNPDWLRQGVGSRGPLGFHAPLDGSDMESAIDGKFLLAVEEPNQPEPLSSGELILLEERGSNCD